MSRVLNTAAFRVEEDYCCAAAEPREQIRVPTYSQPTNDGGGPDMILSLPKSHADGRFSCCAPAFLRQFRYVRKATGDP